MKKAQKPCKKIKVPSNQTGGYKKGFRLQKTTSDTRFERSFTQILSDGTTSGNYIGYDYAKRNPEGKYQMQGTSWLSAVKKAYRQNCTEFREAYRYGRILEDYDISEDDWEEALEVWSGLSKAEKNQYREEVAQVQCEPMEILLRETTIGNNKADFSFREKKYYVTSESVAPKKVTPSRGPTPRIYRFKPKVYPMKLKETTEEFKERKGL